MFWGSQSNRFQRGARNPTTITQLQLLSAPLAQTTATAAASSRYNVQQETTKRLQARALERGRNSRPCQSPTAERSCTGKVRLFTGRVLQPREYKVLVHDDQGPSRRRKDHRGGRVLGDHDTRVQSRRMGGQPQQGDCARQDGSTLLPEWWRCPSLGRFSGSTRRTERDRGA